MKSSGKWYEERERKGIEREFTKRSPTYSLFLVKLGTKLSLITKLGMNYAFTVIRLL